MPTSPTAVPDARATVERGPRGFAALHRDTWRVVARMPVLVLVLPVLVWFPFDLLAELIASASADGALEQFRSYNQVQRITSFLLGGWVNATVLVGVFALARGEDTSVGAVWGRAKRNYQNVLVTTWSVGWRVGLATLLFIIPGIVLAVRYALALPIAVREGAGGRDAVELSSQYTEGHRWRIFGYTVVAALIYVMLAMPLAMVVPADPLWSTISTVPFNLIATAFTVASVLLYAEITVDRASAPPVGRVPRDEVLRADAETSSGRLGVGVAVGLAVLAFCTAFLWLAVTSPGEEPDTLSDDAVPAAIFE
jgi:hypothetical protein